MSFSESDLACVRPSASEPDLGIVQRMQQERVLIIEPGRAERNYWSDLWHYRELFAILAWRDMAVRYKQTVIGVAWAVIRPFLTMVIFTIVFGKLAKFPATATYLIQSSSLQACCRGSCFPVFSARPPIA